MRGVVSAASFTLPMRLPMWRACWRYCTSVAASRPSNPTDVIQSSAACATVIDFETGVCDALVHVKSKTFGEATEAPPVSFPGRTPALWAATPGPARGGLSASPVRAGRLFR